MLLSNHGRLGLGLVRSPKVAMIEKPNAASFSA
jgi:hypothetical protein